ncbi:MAG: PHP domain-containing protein [Gemmataceae bacterium]|nr:PHP domain-containing protein [Gemmataceae bacterium]
MKFDLHIHTSRHSPDSEIDPFALLRRARAVGLDGIVITEHDWLWTEEELRELRASAPELVVLAGIEVSCREGHFLTYGVTNPFAVPRGIGVAKLCREVHRQGGAVVAAHPFRWGQRFDDILRREHPELDGLELMTSNMDADGRRRAALIQQDHQLAGLGSSDAHSEEIVGVCYTDFDVPIATTADLVAAIRARRSTAHARS